MHMCFICFTLYLMAIINTDDTCAPYTQLKKLFSQPSSELSHPLPSFAKYELRYGEQYGDSFKNWK